MYKAAVVGCGRRAAAHAEAYAATSRGKLVAACDPDAARREAFGKRFGITSLYADTDEMLAAERPDLVHVVTLPFVRLEVLAAADRHRVPAVILEKPIASDGADYLALRNWAAQSRVRVCVNHQKHFLPAALKLQRAVRDGQIGEVRFIDVSGRMNLAYQGTHLLELASALSGAGAPTEVFSQVSGAVGLREPDGHFAPDQSVSSISYGDRLRAQFLCGENAPVVSPDGPISRNMRVAVYGNRGLAQWTMLWAEITGPDGSLCRTPYDFLVDNPLSQIALTEAAFDWLDNERAVHPTSLDVALTQFNIVLGIYASALSHAPVRLPVEPRPDTMAALRQWLE
jgi:predicted dehydrogenase